jgi:hypothetical protein
MRILTMLSGGLAVIAQANPVTAWQNIGLELDHVYLAVSPFAPEGAALREAGFSFVPDTAVHTGQGTVSIAAVFENVYLELIWLEGGEDPLAMKDRIAWRETGASPFGIGLRRVDTLASSLPFETRSHHAPWMLEVAVNENDRPTDPAVFVVPPYMSMPAMIQVRGQPPAQPLGVHRVTHVRVHGPHPGGMSPAVRILHESGVVVFEESREHRLDLIFDGGAQGKHIDLRPRLPLVIQY